MSTAVLFFTLLVGVYSASLSPQKHLEAAVRTHEPARRATVRAVKIESDGKTDLPEMRNEDKTDLPETSNEVDILREEVATLRKEVETLRTNLTPRQFEKHRDKNKTALFQASREKSIPKKSISSKGSFWSWWPFDLGSGPSTYGGYGPSAYGGYDPFSGYDPYPTTGEGYHAPQEGYGEWALKIVTLPLTVPMGWFKRAIYPEPWEDPYEAAASTPTAEPSE